MSIKEEILKGFFRGLGYTLSTIFVAMFVALISLIVITIFFRDIIPEKQCISWNYKNGEKVCVKYEYK